MLKKSVLALTAGMLMFGGASASYAQGQRPAFVSLTAAPAQAAAVEAQPVAARPRVAKRNDFVGLGMLPLLLGVVAVAASLAALSGGSSSSPQ